MTPVLNPHSIAVLLLIVVALVLFAQERVRLETSSLLVLIALVLGFQLYPYATESGKPFNPAEFFMGFGHEALLTICALMMLGRGIEISGALKPLTSLMAKYWGQYPTLSLAMTLVIGALLSGFLNNTPIVVMLLPVLIGVALSNNKSPSKILIPVGLATLIGGTATTIGTSTNLLIVAIAEDLNIHRFTMFDFAMPVVLVGGIGLLYLVFIAPMLLPQRALPLQNKENRVFRASLMVTEDSSLHGKTLADVLRRTDYKMEISRVVRGDNQLIKLPTITLKSGDGLIISGTAEQLIDYSQQFKADLYSLNDRNLPISKDNPFTEDDQVLAEILVTEGSFLANKTLKETRFAKVHELVVLALHRLNKPQQIDSSISDVALHRGDILLVQGKPENLQRLKDNTRLLVLNNTIHVTSSKKAPIAIFTMLAVIAIAALQLLPISVSALTGVGIMLLTRCLNWREISHALNPSIIMIIVVSLALGKAMQITSADQFLSHQFIVMMQGLPPVVILAALIFLMSLLTNVVSNTAAAVIGTPVAINIAQELGSSPEAFILAVLFGVNMSYATPIGYQTNLMIFSAGGYKFSDFLRAGIPLTIIMGLGFTLYLAAYYQI
ncbi:SLC13 family permease [Thalassotalea mangrovi]|uniref:SLC13 family permease n=1 Tax=Thalassotalea mangrovi TaxID=2572245 RepID=A0A4U1B9J2_9GAMM|nr:SLC13 family permease [Thalassotalea mangrovi]TKB47440.1 SLC13 family permease [Thalassotalea mangrovi]